MHGQRRSGDATGFCRPHLPDVNVQSVDTATTSTNDADEIGPGKHEYSQNTHSVAEPHKLGEVDARSQSSAWAVGFDQGECKRVRRMQLGMHVVGLADDPAASGEY